jgi:hypothetical protein
MGARSLNGGTSWSVTPSPPGLGPDAGLVDVAVDAGGRLWGLVQDFPNGQYHGETKIYYSDDKGDSWTLATSLNAGSFGYASGWRILPHPANPNIVAAIGFSHNIPQIGDYRGFILYTSDGGASWSHNLDASIREGLYGVMSLHDAVMLPSGRIIAQGPFGIQSPPKWSTLSSTNFGDDWTTSWTVTETYALTNGLFVDRSGTRVGFIYTPNYSSQPGEHYLMLSTDSGTTFQQASLSQELKDFIDPDLEQLLFRFASSAETDSLYVAIGDSSFDN